MASITSGVSVAIEVVNTLPLKTEHAPGKALYVSTELSTWTANEPERLARDVQVNDIAYRRLDSEYYAWLRNRMHMAKLSVLAGQFSQEAFDTTRDSFNRIHE